jgi:hypothetical protein
MAVPRPHSNPTAPREREWKWDETDKLDGVQAAPSRTDRRRAQGRLEGVASAMNVIQGGRGGVDLPEDEIEAVYEHLAHHYREFGEDPPDR